MSGPYKRANRLTIRTAEGISFSLWLAGPTTRFLAWAIDLACIIVFFLAMSAALGLAGLVFPDWAPAALGAGAFITLTGYAMTLEWFWRGQTLGKRILRLRVVDEQGLKLQFSQVALRNFMRIVDALPMFYFLGGPFCFFNTRRQRLGDLAANTVVVHVPKLQQPDLGQLSGDKFNSFREYPHLAARVRQLVTPEEADLALNAILRREDLDADARVKVFDAFAEHFRGKAAFPEEATLGLSDEQYVRNVVDLVFQTRAAPITSGAPEPRESSAPRSPLGQVS